MKATTIKALATATVAVVLLSSEAVAQGAGRLDKIRESGSITLGYPETSVPFAYLDGNQKPVGYTVEICEQVVQAIKTALKLPKLEIRYNPITSATRIQLLATVLSISNAATRPIMSSGINSSPLPPPLSLRRSSSSRARMAGSMSTTRLRFAARPSPPKQAARLSR